MIRPWLDRWALRPDGPLLRTPSSVLQPVRDTHDRAGMLKLAEAEEERFGNGLMVWWAGDGAAPVWAADGPALLMARATGGDLLADFRAPAREAGAVAALTGVLARLHSPRPGPPLEAIPMPVRCAALLRVGGPTADLARRLLDEPRDQALLHGDAHPGNILDFGTRDFGTRDFGGGRLAGDRPKAHPGRACL